MYFNRFFWKLYFLWPNQVSMPHHCLFFPTFIGVSLNSHTALILLNLLKYVKVFQCLMTLITDSPFHSHAKVKITWHTSLPLLQFHPQFFLQVRWSPDKGTFSTRDFCLEFPGCLFPPIKTLPIFPKFILNSWSTFSISPKWRWLLSELWWPVLARTFFVLFYGFNLTHTTLSSIVCLLTNADTAISALMKVLKLFILAFYMPVINTLWIFVQLKIKE